MPIHCAHTLLADPSALRPNPDNPNRHSAHQIQLLAAIITEQGWRSPITVVIMSRSRARSISSHRLFPSATLVVPESELADYSAIPLEKIAIPDSVCGVSAVRNWIVRRFDEEAIVMLDDDISACMCMVSLKVCRLSVSEPP